jgi:class I fructose-bisphosphate aldolase
MVTTLSSTHTIADWLGAEADSLLDYEAKVPKSTLHLPGPDWVDRIFAQSDRNPQVLRSLQQLYSSGRLANTGYLSILPVDQGIEHSAGASFAPNPMYFDPQNIVELAIAGGCNAVATTLGVLGSVSRRYAHKIPFILKLNHNELLTAPNRFDQVMFADVEQAWNLGAVAVGPPSTLALMNRLGKFKRSAPPFSGPTSWAWPPFSGATYAAALQTRPRLPHRRRPHRPG